MANITHEQLIEYDSKIKEYINNVVNDKVSSYEQQIDDLNHTIDDLNQTIDNLQNNDQTNIENNLIIEPASESDNLITTKIATPMLRTLSSPIVESTPSLRSIRPTSIVVEEDIQEDYIVYDRIIYPNDQAIYKNIVVTTDDRSNRVFFNMWKTFDDRELIDKTISIVWINAAGYKGETECVDIQQYDDRLTFAWNIPYAATRTAGTIKYAIRITTTDYIWNTLPADIECVQGLIDDAWDDLPDAEGRMEPKTELAFCQITYDDNGHITGSEDITEMQLAALNSGVTSDTLVEIVSLQSQIDQIVIASAEEYVVAPEVAQARVSSDGTSYPTLKDRIDVDDNAIESLNQDMVDTNNFITDVQDFATYIADVSDSYINGVNDLTIETESNVSVRQDYNFIKGRKYAYTNLTSGAVNLKVYDAKGTSTTIFSSVQPNKTSTFICESDYVELSCWAQETGSVVLAAIDDGLLIEDQHIKDYGALVDIDELFKINNEAFTIVREGNGAKFITKRNISSGNFGVSLPVPIKKLSIKSIEFDIISYNGSPQIFVSYNGTLTHINRLIMAANATFSKQHIIFDIPEENIADGDSTTLSFWNSNNALQGGYFVVSNLEFKRDTTHNSVNELTQTVPNIQDFISFVDFYSVLSQNANIFDMEKVGSGIKFTTNRDIPSGNFGVTLNLPIRTYAIESIEFDIESIGGSPQIFVSKNSGLTHLVRLIYEENANFSKRHIAFDIPADNIADGDETFFSIWNANHALKDGYFIVSNFVVKRNTIYNKITNLNAADIPINNKLISNMTEVSAWNYGTITKYDNYITYTPVDGQNGGVQSPTISNSKRGFLNLEFEIAENYHTDLYVYLFGKSTSDSNLYIQIANGIRSANTYKYTIDLNHYVVYQNLDLTQPVRVAVTTTQPNNAEVLKLNKFNVYDSTCDLDVDGSVSDGLNYVNSAVISLANQVDSMSSNMKVTDENGNTYLLQVSNGQLVIVPTLASNILYIGNSLLLGFTTFGMAAKNSVSDYYHYVNEYLTNKGLTLTTDRLMGADWESCTTYSAQNAWMQNTLLPKLNNNLELVIVQLGDNVNTTEKQAVFAQGAINLLRYIRQHTSRARLAWVGAWYTTATKQQQMAEACKQCGASFVDISLLPDIEGNKNHIGGIWTDDNGVEHVIDNSGVASHPSSQGMRAIADKIIEVLF